MSLLWTDGTWTTESAVSDYRFSAPIPGVETVYVATQDFMVFRANYNPPAVGASQTIAVNGVNKTFYFVSDSSGQDLGGGVMRFTRTWARVPATHYEPETFGYTFVGFTQSLGSGAYETRDPWTQKVLSRVRHDYFVLGVTVTDPITGGSVTPASEGDIPQILGMVYVFQGAVGGATYGGLSLATKSLNVQGAALPTWPTSDDYLTMISDALQHSWGATVSNVVVNATSTLAGGPPATSGHTAGTINTGSSVQGGIIPAENSWVERWMGAIFVRKTRYILAQ